MSASLAPFLTSVPSPSPRRYTTGSKTGSARLLRWRCHTVGGERQWQAVQLQSRSVLQRDLLRYWDWGTWDYRQHWASQNLVGELSAPTVIRLKPNRFVRTSARFTSLACTSCWPNMYKATNSPSPMTWKQQFSKLACYSSVSALRR